MYQAAYEGYDLKATKEEEATGLHIPGLGPLVVGAVIALITIYLAGGFR